MNIKSKLLISYLSLILFSVSALAILINNKSQATVFTEVKEKSEHISQLIENTINTRYNLLNSKLVMDLSSAERALYDYGIPRRDNSDLVKIGDYIIANVYFGNYPAIKNTALMDTIKAKTGSFASIFLLHKDNLIQVSANKEIVEKEGVGLSIAKDSEIYSNIIKNTPYYGRQFLDDQWYLVGYKPLLDQNNQVIGAISIGYRELGVSLLKTISDLKIGKSGYVFLMNGNGDLLVHPKFKGTNIKDYSFFQTIVSKKNGVTTYTFNGSHKLASYKYFKPWDCYIVATSNYSDLESSFQSIFSTTLVIAVVVIILSLIFAYLMTNAFVRPINELKNCIEIAGKGDLSVRCTIKNKDEIGVLSESFNHMIEENKRLIEETMQYDKMKTEFIANISHELRTPLNIIFSTAQLLSLYSTKKDAVPLDADKTAKYNTIIKQNCYRLLRLVNNLIDITKIDSGYMETTFRNGNIIDIIENITMSTVDYVESKSRSIIFDTDVEEKIMAFDAEKMERIILNLISNATKFTLPGDTIYVTIADKGDSIVISVKDTGIGIPAEEKDKVFQRFKQIDSLLNRRHEGSGIGLALVKSLVEMHGGTISVESKFGEGTEFIINLPVRIIEDANIDKSEEDFPKPINVEKIEIEFSDIYS